MSMASGISHWYRSVRLYAGPLEGAASVLGLRWVEANKIDLPFG